MATYRLLTGLDSAGLRYEAGDLVSNLPSNIVSVLLAEGSLELVSSYPQPRIGFNGGSVEVLADGSVSIGGGRVTVNADGSINITPVAGKGIAYPVAMAPATIPAVPPSRTSDSVAAVGEAIGYTVTVPQVTKLRRIRLRVAAQSGQLSAGLYNAARQQLATSGAVSTGPVGAMEIALPPTAIPAGLAQLWYSTSDAVVSVGYNATHGDTGTVEFVPGAGQHPLPATLAGVLKSSAAPILVAYPDDPTPLTSVYSRTDLAVSVLGKNAASGRLYGVNFSFGQWTYSDDSGTTWTRAGTGVNLASNPDANTIGLVVQGANWYAYTGTGKIYRNALETYTGWTDVSVPGLPAGTTGRPDSLVSDGTNLYYGNYNASANAGAYVWTSADNGATWTQVLSVPTARHVHAIGVDPANASHVFVTIGDSGGTYTNIGLYYSATPTVPASYALLAGNRSLIDMAFQPAVSGIPQRIFFEGDGLPTPHVDHFYQSLIGSTGHLSDPLVWPDTSPSDGRGSWAGTVRAICLTTTGHLFWISTTENGAVGIRAGVWCARGPWCTTPVLLEEITGQEWSYTKTFESGNYLINGRYRMTRPAFAGQ